MKLTLRALQKSNVANEVVVVNDGAAALDYLFGTGAHAGRDVTLQPAIMRLDLKLPKMDGLEVLRRARADARTKRLPVVILTRSKEDRDIIASYDLGANGYGRKSVDFDDPTAAAGELGMYWLLLNEASRTGVPSHG